jgi:predicted DNA-binding protein (MmcQ/YjbR family)
MELESLRAYLLKKKGAFEDFPFGPKVNVINLREPKTI